MKKLIGTAMLAALLATSAFAELSISGGATQLWSPIAYNGGDVMTGIQNPWGGARSASVGFTWVSEDGKAGTSLAFVYNPWDYAKYAFDDKGNSKEQTPTAYGDGAAFSLANADGTRVIWVKPWDFLKVSFGHWDGINDISAVNTASWDWARPNNWITQLYSENQATGALFEITPIESLMVRVGLPFVNPDIAYHMFEGITADVEYTIEDLLGIKVGWRGGRNSHSTMTPSIYKKDGDFLNVGEVNVFLSLLAVENLQLDLGARINILSSDYADGYSSSTTPTKYNEFEGFSGTSAIIGLKAGYNITDNFSVKADFAVQTYKKTKISGKEYGSHKPDFAFGVGIGYGLTDSLELVADFRGLIKGDLDVKNDKTYSADPTFSFLVGLNYTCSTNASVGIGFQGKTNGGDIGPLGSNNDNFGFAVPIRVNVSF